MVDWIDQCIGLVFGLCMNIIPRLRFELYQTLSTCQENITTLLGIDCDSLPNHHLCLRVRVHDVDVAVVRWAGDSLPPYSLEQTGDAPRQAISIHTNFISMG
jgi:hypothetical protein